MERIGVQVLAIWFYRTETITTSSLLLLRIIEPLPAVLFIVMITSWKRKVWLIFLLALVLEYLSEIGNGRYGLFQLLYAVIPFGFRYAYTASLISDRCRSSILIGLIIPRRGICPWRTTGNF